VKIFIKYGSEKLTFRRRRRKHDTDKTCYIISKISILKI